MGLRVLFGALFIVIIVILVIGLVFLYRRVRHIVMGGKSPADFEKNARTKRSWIAAIPVAILLILCVIRPYFWVVPVLHLIVIWAILHGVFAIVEKIRRAWAKRASLENEDQETKASRKIPYWLSGALALVITVVYMCVAFYLAHHVVETRYQVSTEKQVPKLEIAMIADSHLGTCFDGEGFAKHLETIQAQHPDLLVICGDFVDDDSSREDLEVACEALGTFTSTYGVFYVPGNHDKGFGNYRDFSYEELTATLESNGVTVLEDEVVELGECFYLIGRKDRMMDRLPIEDLTADLDPSRFTIVLNHQPNDYETEASAHCDLVLSGHTHGGQMIPIGPIGELIGANDATYGLEVRENTTFIVTSGIADWAIPYKSGTVSEYVIIEVSGEQK